MIVIIILITLLIIIYIVYSTNKNYNDNMILEKATFDNNVYLVQDKDNKAQSANKLAYLKNNIQTIVNYLQQHQNDYPDYPIVNLISRTKNIIIQERPANETDYTSYTVNKGEKIVFCIRSSYLDTIHDNNILMYVMIHELAHILSNNVGHGEEFVKNFKFLLNIAVKLNLYKIENYEKNPMEYCNMTINEYLFDK